MNRVFKRLLKNIAFALIFLTLICGGIEGMYLLVMLFRYLSVTINPFVGFVLIMLVFALILGVFFTAVGEYCDRDW